MAWRLILAMFAAVPSAAAPVTPGELPEWLAGRWCTAEGPHGQTCEQWQAPAGGMMLGTSQTVKDGRTIAFEFVRIAMDGDVAVYLPQPGGGPPVRFRVVAGEEGVTFVNAAHDYPQRIHYQLAGEELIAEISLADGSKARRWTYRRVR